MVYPVQGVSIYLWKEVFFNPTIRIRRKAKKCLWQMADFLEKLLTNVYKGKGQKFSFKFKSETLCI